MYYLIPSLNGQMFRSRKTYCDIEDTTGHSKLHSDTDAERLSRYRILSHQAGMRFFSPESYPIRRQFTQVYCSEESNVNA